MTMKATTDSGTEAAAYSQCRPFGLPTLYAITEIMSSSTVAQNGG